MNVSGFSSDDEEMIRIRNDGNVSTDHKTDKKRKKRHKHKKSKKSKKHKRSKESDASPDEELPGPIWAIKATSEEKGNDDVLNPETTLDSDEIGPSQRPNLLTSDPRA